MTRSRAADDMSRTYGQRADVWRGRLNGAVRLARRGWLIGERRRSECVFATVFVALVAIVGLHLDHERIGELEQAGRELDLGAAELARQIDAEIGAAPAEAPAEALHAALASLPEFKRERVVLVDPSGAIVASEPRTSPAAAMLAELLGAAAPLAILAEKAGTLAIDGPVEGLASIRNLRALRGQIAVIEPSTEVLAPWRRRARLVVALMASTGLALGGALSLHTRQMRWSRRHALEDLMRRRHMELALARGRCGLWDWDLDSGVVAWSRSMFEILGLPPRETLTIAQIEDLVHPDDKPLAGLIEAALRRGDGEVDIEFRLLAADGDWVWIRQRAAIIEDRARHCRRLVGVALDVTDRKREAEVSATADQRLREAIEAISEAFVLWDSSNRLVLCNSKYQRLHNLNPDAACPGASYADVAALSSAPIVSTETPLAGERPGPAPRRPAHL